MSSHERAAAKKCPHCLRELTVNDFSARASWCKGCINAYSKQHYRKRREHVLKLKRNYRRSNPEKISQLNVKWRAENSEKARAYMKEYRRTNRGKKNAHEARRHSDKLQRTPHWADLKAIEAIYSLAKAMSVETGIRHSVDHFYPLRGKTVSGLHVAGNLRVIPLRDNLKKKNRVPVEDIV